MHGVFLIGINLSISFVGFKSLGVEAAVNCKYFWYFLVPEVSIAGVLFVVVIGDWCVI